MSNSSTAKPTINGCGNIKEDFTNLCDLDALWGIIVSGFAALGLLLTFVFTIIFSVNLKRYVRHQRHHYSTLLYFVLLGAFLLFAFSIAFVIKPSPIVCCLRRVGFGMACVVVLAPLFVGITRTWRMSYLDELRCGFLGMAVVCIVLVEAIILAEWNILKRPTVLSSGRCEETENDLVYSSSFNGLVLILFFISTMVACCKKDHHVTTRKRLNGYVMSCLAISVLLVLLTTAWATMICYGNEKLGKPEWSDPTTA
uniref:G-protein coupled receptors family 3 profile domain-containing protein n=1 Tax=Ciona savignyi TaxID=51511 RepID=H2ZCM3_CIOSA